MRTEEEVRLAASLMFESFKNAAPRKRQYFAAAAAAGALAWALGDTSFKAPNGVDLGVEFGELVDDLAKVGVSPSN